MGRSQHDSALSEAMEELREIEHRPRNDAVVWMTVFLPTALGADIPVDVDFKARVTSGMPNIRVEKSRRTDTGHSGVFCFSGETFSFLRPKSLVAAQTRRKTNQREVLRGILFSLLCSPHRNHIRMPLSTSRILLRFFFSYDHIY